MADLVLSLKVILEPPERLTVSQWAEKKRFVNNRGSYVGMWKNSTAPYMVEPMDMLTSPVHDAVIMAAPAQCSKTDSLIVNFIGYTIESDPMDMMVVNPTSSMSRDFSKRRVDKLLRDTKVCGELLNDDRHADNIGDKHFRNGVFLSLVHPSVSELAGRPIPRVLLTDYDRMDDDIGGDGSAFDLGQKRTTTFGSYRMTVAESSPSRPIEDPNWVAVDGSHEAPPTKGIFALYNRGDRRRWYWACPHCSKRFEGTFDMLRWDKQSSDMMHVSDSTYMECPHCHNAILQSQRHDMQQTGQWLRDGEFYDVEGKRVGKGAISRTASFWLRGVAACFVSWGQLVTMFLAAEDEYERTGSEDALVKFFNTDLAEPYVPKVMSQQRLPEHIRSRAIDIGERVVPEGVRCLVACVDVQKNRFVVQVHGIGAGTPFDVTIIDRFDIRKSRRYDENEDAYAVRPHTFLEDWGLIEELVMDKLYPLSDGSGRAMGVTLTVCDSGGYSKDKGESTTAMAYDFYRELKRKGRAKRFHLVKGIKSPNAPRAMVNYPDASRKDSLSAARGDVPVLMLNSNLLKDTLSNRLDATESGAGVITFPDWLDISFFQELCAETRKPNGWAKQSHQNNEAWDLLYYCLGVCVSKLLPIDRVDWVKPPVWLEEWDKNSSVYQPSLAEEGDTADNVVIYQNASGETVESNAVEATPSWEDINDLFSD